MKYFQKSLVFAITFLMGIQFSCISEKTMQQNFGNLSISNKMIQNHNEIRPVYNEQTGFWEMELVSVYQSGPAKVELLLPDNILEKGVKFPVLYILPVGGPSAPFGDGLIEAQKADLANKYGIICIRPYFTSVPWYGDHAENPHIRHESYLSKCIVPLIDSLYPTMDNSKGRWLIGFSKSGWGACTLLMRNPEIFGYAAAWDAPFMLSGENSGQKWGPMGLRVNFGTKEQMQQSLPTTLAENSSWLSKKTRLVIGPGQYWEKQSKAYHDFLNELGIPHVYLSDLLYKHRWDTGWFVPMAEALISIARNNSVP